MHFVPRELVEYEKPNGKSPFSEWLNGLKDVVARAGDKGSQDRDIQKAKEYWQDYRR